MNEAPRGYHVILRHRLIGRLTDSESLTVKNEGRCLCYILAIMTAHPRIPSPQ